MSTHTTVEFTAGTLVDDVEAVESLPARGRYEVNRHRFVVEPAIRMLGVPVLRGRFECAAGHLVLADGGTEAELELDLAAGSLRANVFGLARTLTGKGGLCVSDHPVIRFRSTAMTLADDRTIDVTGRLEVLDVVRELRLSGRLAHVDERSVVVWLTGALPPPRRPLESGYWIAQVLAGRTMRIELAAEFTR